MDNGVRVDDSAPLEPVQGHLFEIVRIVEGIGPIYRPNLGFSDLSIRYEAAAVPPPAET